MRRFGSTFHPRFPAVHRTHAAPMADAGAGPEGQEPPRTFRQNACRDFSDVRLRQSKPPLPRFPKLLWSEPVDGKTAGKGERCAEGTRDFDIDFLKPHIDCEVQAFGGHFRTSRMATPLSSLLRASRRVVGAKFCCKNGAIFDAEARSSSRSTARSAFI